MDAAGRASLEFLVLGPVEVRRDGRSVPLGGARQETLMSLLLLAPGRPASAARLIDEIWAGEPPAGAETTLRSYVSRLRARLGSEQIAASGSGYALAVAPEQIDAHRFARLAREAESALARRNPGLARELATEALALWRGPAFSDAALDGPLQIEAARLEELRLRVTELKLEAALALAEGPALVDELEALVREHPFRERLWHHLMLALYRSDRQADALAAYHRARQQLGTQLGLDPGEELERLQQQILNHAVPPVAPPEARHNLPAPLTSFVGRRAELAEIAGLLDTSRLVTLVGVGGVGKTRLALEAARARVHHHADGVTFIDLAPLADPDLVAGHVAATLEIREQAGDTPLDRLRRHLLDADTLLVLDNCEHVRSACAELAEALLATCRDLRLLTTSREILGVPGEAAYPVPPLGLPAAGAAAGFVAWRDAEAVRLFLARAREARPGIGDDDATIETVARICRDLDGLPLGIELAAARARALSPAEIAARLADRFRFLVSWRRLTAARHRTLREAMDWSYSLLEPDGQRVLRSLAVFAGGFTLEAVAALCSEGDEERALQHLERLVEASLVTVDAGQDPTRYGILETVRQYGDERLVELGERESLQARHAAYYGRVAETARAADASSFVQAAWVQRIGQERENLRAALAWHQQASDLESLLRMSEALWPFWWIRGELTEGRSSLETALAHATAADAGLRARGHLGAGGLAWAQADYGPAEDHSNAARALFAELGDALEEGNALNTLGLIADARGEPARARALFERAIARYRAADVETARTDRHIAVAVDNLGWIAYELGEPEVALDQYRVALEMNRRRGDREGVAMNELHIAFIEAEAGRLDEARRLLANALPVYGSVGFRQYAAECLEVGSIVANAVGQPREAAFLLGAASRMRDEAGSPPVPSLAVARAREMALAEATLGPDAVAEIVAEAGHAPVDAAIERALLLFRGTRPG